MMTIFRHAPIMLLAMAMPALAQPVFEDLGMLDARVAETLDAAIGAAGGAIAPIDRRLRLAACPAPATIAAPVAGAITIRCQALGWRIRVAVGGPTRATESSGGPPRAAAEPIVRRGETVDLVISARGFSVSGSGVAEQSGAAGDRIRVRLANGNRVASGQVRADGRVAITGFN